MAATSRQFENLELLIPSDRWFKTDSLTGAAPFESPLRVLSDLLFECLLQMRFDHEHAHHRRTGVRHYSLLESA
jgi:hypothetical protein